MSSPKDPSALAATLDDDAAAPQARAKALAALAVVDPSAAVRHALPFLADEVLDSHPLFPISQVALDVLAQHADGEDGARAVDRLLEIFFGRRQSGYDTWARGGLERMGWPGTAARVAAELTPETFKRSTGALELLTILRARREVGDRARVEPLAKDPWTFLAALGFGDHFLEEIWQRAGEVLEAARRE